MIEPNVLSFFLIILCGFGVVWSFRHFSKRKSNEIHEFEYVAFSAVWGSLIFLPVLIILHKHPNLMEVIGFYPFIATPALFLLGLFVGRIGVWLVNGFKILVKYFNGKFNRF